MAYKVNKKDGKSSPNVWNAQAESLIAHLAVILEKERGLKKEKVVNDLNYKYLKKRVIGNKQNYIATRLQRSILNNEGY